MRNWNKPDKQTRVKVIYLYGLQTYKKEDIVDRAARS